MKHLAALLISTLLAGIASTACHDIDEYNNTVYGNFDALWTIVDEHYCFFDEKDVDWNQTYRTYRSRLNPQMTTRELFDVCAEMLATLRDGHTNLSASFQTSYYRNWWSDYPQNFSERLIEQSYFNFNYKQVGGMIYGILPQNIGYMRISSFATPIGESNLDAILSDFVACKGLIVDVRDNGGGDLTNVETIVARFIEQRTLMGYILHKTGPGHNDFSKPYAYYVNPAANRQRWAKPVAVLTNRSTYSAANNFVSFMSHLPTVTIVGARTGGGSGMPFSSEIPCGWGIRFSGSPILDSAGLPTEFGIDPTPGFAIDMDPEAALTGIDTILEKAISCL